VTERKNTLSMVLSLLAAHAWLSFREASEARDEAAAAKRRAKRPAAPAPLLRRPAALLGLSLAAFTLALFAKTTASVLPAVLLVIAWWRQGRLGTRDVKPLLPFFAVGAGLAWLTAWLEKTMVRAEGQEWAHGIWDRVVLAGQTTAFYAWKLVWPADLAFIYRRWTVDATVPAQWLPALGWLAALAAAFVLARRGLRGPLAALLLFGGVLFPAMGFFNVYAMRYSWVADHFAYQAVAVGCAALVCGAATLLSAAPAAVVRAAAAAAVAGLALLGALTSRAAVPYRDSESLWLHTIALNPECFICHTNYGRELLEKGRTDEAVRHFERSLEIKPDALPTLLNLAQVEEARGQLGRAAERLRAALALEPTDGEIRTHLGTIFTKEGRLADAEREFREALKTPSPADYLAHNGLGVVLVKTGRIPEGIAHMEECVRLRPDYEKGRANLEMVLSQIQRR
jgi:tetratricopeptide (TPR) repeat protein